MILITAFPFPRVHAVQTHSFTLDCNLSITYTDGAGVVHNNVVDPQNCLLPQFTETVASGEPVIVTGAQTCTYMMAGTSLNSSRLYQFAPSGIQVLLTYIGSPPALVSVNDYTNQKDNPRITFSTGIKIHAILCIPNGSSLNFNKLLVDGVVTNSYFINTAPRPLGGVLSQTNLYFQITASATDEVDFGYRITNPDNLALTYTFRGISGLTSTGNITVDFQSSLTIAGLYTNSISSVTYALWIYQEPSQGFQLYGDQPLSNIMYSDGPPRLKFSLNLNQGTNTIVGCHCQVFVPPALGLTLQNIFNDEVLNSGATFNNNIVDWTSPSGTVCCIISPSGSVPITSPQEIDFIMVSVIQSTTEYIQSSSEGTIASSGTGAGGIIFQIQFTSTTATILNQPVVLTYPVFGNPELIGQGLTILAATLVIVFVGFAFVARRNRRREYVVQRHF